MSTVAQPTFAETLRTFFKIGCLGFGGPAGQIALMHRILVDEKKWIEESRFLHALNFCMLLPGPGSAAARDLYRLADARGARRHRRRHPVRAAGRLRDAGLSLIYALGQGIPLIEGALFGIKAAVLVIVVEALIRIGKRALKTNLLIAIAAFGLHRHFLSGAAVSADRDRRRPRSAIWSRARRPHLLAIKTDGAYPPPVPGRWKQAATAIAIGLAAWWAPVALAALLLGPSHVLVSVGTFFSKLATVSFGGAYALLAYMAQQAVETKGWMTAAEMVDGLGLAETTPGPLILVTQFVGFLAGYRDAAPFSPVTAGVIAAAMTTWVTFTASMLWIFAGAPFVEQLRSNRMLTGALAAITAAVVGVILNLTVWFALHVLFVNVTEQRTRHLPLVCVRSDGARSGRPRRSPSSRRCSRSAFIAGWWRSWRSWRCWGSRCGWCFAVERRRVRLSYPSPLAVRSID